RVLDAPGEVAGFPELCRPLLDPDLGVHVADPGPRALVRERVGAEDGQGHLAVLDVVPDGLADGRLLADEVEAVVDDLEGEADLPAELPQEEPRVLPAARVARAELAGRGVEARGLPSADRLVVLLGEIEVEAAR